MKAPPGSEQHPADPVDPTEQHDLRQVGQQVPEQVEQEPQHREYRHEGQDRRDPRRQVDQLPDRRRQIGVVVKGCPAANHQAEERTDLRSNPLRYPFTTKKSSASQIRISMKPMPYPICLLKKQRGQFREPPLRRLNC